MFIYNSLIPNNSPKPNLPRHSPIPLRLRPLFFHHGSRITAHPALFLHLPRKKILPPPRPRVFLPAKPVARQVNWICKQAIQHSRLIRSTPTKYLTNPVKNNQNQRPLIQIPKQTLS